jgi:hypothetical protein
MDLGQVTRRRNLASKIATAFCVIAFLAMVDGLLVHFREPANFVKVLPGAVIPINGELTDEANNLQDLAFTSDSDQLTVNFEAIHKGYFLGGDMWRGRLIVSPNISPGEYSLAVIPKRAASSRKAPDFRIKVFPDALSLQKSSTSLVRRQLGFLSLRRGGRVPAGDFAGLRRRLLAVRKAGGALGRNRPGRSLPGNQGGRRLGDPVRPGHGARDESRSPGRHL